MIRLDFGEFAVNMNDPVALNNALLGDFAGAYTENQISSSFVQYTRPGSSARIDMLGEFNTPPGGPDSLINEIEIFSDADGDGGYDFHRLKVTGPVEPVILFDDAYDGFMVGGDITALYSGQALEIRGSSGFGDYLVGAGLGDRLLGFGGNDTLQGGLGSDTMTGGAGHDFYFVGAHGDRVVELAGGGTDTVRSTVTEILSPQVERLFLIGPGDINGTGNGLANAILGNAGNNVLDGKGGADILRGGIGADKLVWSAGDLFDGGGGNSDLLLVRGAGVTVDLRLVAASHFKNVERVDLTGIGNNTLRLTVDDVLSSGNNTLRVLGNDFDTVQPGGGWSAPVTQTIGGQEYRVYTQGSGPTLATLLVDTDITVAGG
jgi:Ca2+-binding RTX toxin-like protein